MVAGVMKLEDSGFTIIRIREEPLKKLKAIDIISAKPFDGKLLTKKVLSRIEELFPLDANTKMEIDDYKKKKSTQNEGGLEAYIEQILKEQAKG